MVQPKRVNYLNNKDILKQIHKSKLSYCYIQDDKFANVDLIVDDVKSPEAPTIAELVMHKIHGPSLVDRCWHRQGLWLLPVQAFPGLDPQIQLQFPVDTINTLVVPLEALDVA